MTGETDRSRYLQLAAVAAELARSFRQVGFLDAAMEYDDQAADWRRRAEAAADAPPPPRDPPRAA